MGQIVAALDLGTSKSIALVVRKEHSGELSIIQTETLVSKNAIRRGRVYNSDETSDIISGLIRKLENNPAIQIEKIYVGIGGQSIRSQQLNIKRTVENGTINQQLLDSIRDEALHYKPEFDDNLSLVSCEYYADGHIVSSPRGTVASTIEARYQLIVGNPCLKKSLERVIGKNKISVAGYLISPLATAEAVLTPEEKELGCALVEFGEGVTYISVYKNKSLKFLVTLPLGGLAITKDIRSLNVLEYEAEDLKIKYGSAIVKQNNGEFAQVNKDQNSSWKIDLHDLNCIIEARVDEIVKNIWNQIQISGYSQTLNAGIVITGGGALLRDLPQFIKNYTEKEVRIGKANILVNHVKTYLSPAGSCAAGLVILGEDNCGKEIIKKRINLFGEEDEPEDKGGKKVDKKDKKKDKNPEHDPIQDPVQKPGLPFVRTFNKIKGKIEDTFNNGVIIFDEDINADDNKETPNNNATKKQ